MFSVELMLGLSVTIQAVTSNVAFNNNYYVLTLQNEERMAIKHSFLILINIIYIRILLRIIPNLVEYLHRLYLANLSSPKYTFPRLYSYTLDNEYRPYAEPY